MHSHAATILSVKPIGFLLTFRLRNQHTIVHLTGRYTFLWHLEFQGKDQHAPSGYSITIGQHLEN